MESSAQEIASIATHYLHPGNIFVHREPHVVTTILGSCVAVCLWDPVRMMGGINHYLLPLWNGEGLPTPKYGNVAIKKLIEKMESNGCTRKAMKAKLFGGSSIINSNGLVNVGQRNIAIATELVAEEGITVVGQDMGGNRGRRVLYHTDTGKVMVRLIKNTHGVT